MSGIGPKLPLSVDRDDGAYKLNKTMIDEIKQNFKNILLTAPGERVMMPTFGVGLKNYLFQNLYETTFIEIEAKIHQQVAKYLPFVEIIEINFSKPVEYDLQPNALFIRVVYKILPLDLEDVLSEIVDLTTI